jgi:hypothetical protein
MQLTEAATLDRKSGEAEGSAVHSPQTNTAQTYKIVVAGNPLLSTGNKGFGCPIYALLAKNGIPRLPTPLSLGPKHSGGSDFLEQKF